MFPSVEEEVLTHSLQSECVSSTRGIKHTHKSLQLDDFGDPLSHLSGSVLDH